MQDTLSESALQRVIRAQRPGLGIRLLKVRQAESAVGPPLRSLIAGKGNRLVSGKRQAKLILDELDRRLADGSDGRNCVISVVGRDAERQVVDEKRVGPRARVLSLQGSERGYQLSS